MGKLEGYLLSWDSGEVGRWKVSGFIEERGTQSEFKISHCTKNKVCN